MGEAEHLQTKVAAYEALRTTDDEVGGANIEATGKGPTLTSQNEGGGGTSGMATRIAGTASTPPNGGKARNPPT